VHLSRYGRARTVSTFDQTVKVMISRTRKVDRVAL